MKKTIALLILITMLSAFCGCAPKNAEGELMAMDTFMSFTLYGGESEKAVDEIKQRIKEFDKKLSANDNESEIGKLNSEGEGKLSADSAQLVSRSLRLCADTDGALDITVYPAVRAWGFIDSKYTVPDDKKLEKLTTVVDYKNVNVDKDVVSLKNDSQIDLGATAKGYLADESFEILKKYGVESALLNFGGTVFAYGSKSDGNLWKIGLADPDNSSEWFGMISCTNKTVATSGGYERKFTAPDGTEYIHIIDPATCKPVYNNVLSVSVISSDGTLADALSTALYVMGEKKAVEFYKDSADNFDFVILTKDKKVYVTDGVIDFFALDGYDAEIIRVK